jgi:hypothetical protein
MVMMMRVMTTRRKMIGRRKKMGRRKMSDFVYAPPEVPGVSCFDEGAL